MAASTGRQQLIMAGQMRNSDRSTNTTIKLTCRPPECGRDKIYALAQIIEDGTVTSSSPSCRLSSLLLQILPFDFITTMAMHRQRYPGRTSQQRKRIQRKTGNAGASRAKLPTSGRNRHQRIWTPAKVAGTALSGSQAPAAVIAPIAAVLQTVGS